MDCPRLPRIHKILPIPLRGIPSTAEVVAGGCDGKIELADDRSVGCSAVAEVLAVVAGAKSPRASKLSVPLVVQHIKTRAVFCDAFVDPVNLMTGKSVE